MAAVVLSVVIPTYKKAGRLRLTLRALLAIAKEIDIEVLVVDDGGEQGTSEAVRDVSSCRNGATQTVRLIENPHRGRSATRNRGAALASGQRILFLDDDMLVGPGLLCVHARGAGTLQRGTIVSLPWLVAFDDPATGRLTDTATQSLGTADARGLLGRMVHLESDGVVPAVVFKHAVLHRFERDLHHWLATAPRGRRWPAVTGAQFSIDRGLFLTLGGFDENMGLEWGAEDLEFGYRAERVGVPIVHAKRAIACHMDHDARGRYDQHRRALEYFARKHHDASVLRLLDYFSGQGSLKAAMS